MHTFDQAVRTLSAALAGAGLLVALQAGAQELTVVSFGGSYQDGQSKALFQPGAKAMNIKVKEETYTSIADLRLKVKAGANTWDVVASGSGSAARAGAEGILEKLDYKTIDANFARLGAKRVLLTHMGEAMLAERDKVDRSRYLLAEDGMSLDL